MPKLPQGFLSRTVRDRNYANILPNLQVLQRKILVKHWFEDWFRGMWDCKYDSPFYNRPSSCPGWARAPCSRGTAIGVEGGQTEIRNAGRWPVLEERFWNHFQPHVTTPSLVVETEKESFYCFRVPRLDSSQTPILFSFLESNTILVRYIDILHFCVLSTFPTIETS